MNRQRYGSHAISGAFVFLLLGVFAVFGTLAVLMGVGAYNSISSGAALNNRARIAPAYLRTMVRAHDTTDGVRVEKLTGILRENEDTGDTFVEPVSLDAVVLSDEIALTRLFVYDGWLYECSEPLDEGEVFGDVPGDVYLDETETAMEEDPALDASFAADAPLPEGVCPGYRMQPVCEAAQMEASVADGLLTIRLHDGAEWTELYCALRAALP